MNDIEIDATDNNKKEETSSNAETKVDASLPPPPRPDANVDDSNAPPFIQQGSAIPSHLSFEPNPFEHSFAGGGGVETPGGTKLPSVAALTSPASLVPGGGTTPYPWAGGSLRTGPLSPAMLSGPADYFTDTHHLRGGFTPNESSLRTGLTPGGGGSMFPAPSPGSQALFNAMASGGATPGTLDFHRTAMNAAAAQKREASAQRITSQPQEMPNGIDNNQQQNNTKQEAFAQHDANDAANGLFMLAQSRNNSQGVSQYQMAQQQPVHAHPHPPQQQQQQQQDPRHNGSVTSGRGMSEASAQSDESEQQRPNTRNKASKKAPSTTTNGRRKAEDTPSKTPATKKGKANNGNANNHYMEPEPPSEDEQDMKQDEYNANGKKMTDDEKRKNFLERNRYVLIFLLYTPLHNPHFVSGTCWCLPMPSTVANFAYCRRRRSMSSTLDIVMMMASLRHRLLSRFGTNYLHSVAALKCRQRKKQWLANLQSKVEMFSSENDQLSSQISALREEVVALKTMLLAHKDCPVTQSQGMAGGYMPQQMPEYGGHGPQMANPYGMAMQGQQQQVMAGQGGMGRRFS